MSAWKVLLDQNIRYEVKGLLEQAGFDAHHTSDFDLQRKTDPDILAYATQIERTLVTLDKDLGA